LFQKTIQRKYLFVHICRMSNDKRIIMISDLLKAQTNGLAAPRVRGHHRTVWSWSTRVEPCRTGQKNVGGNSKEGIKHQQALSPRFLVMI